MLTLMMDWMLMALAQGAQHVTQGVQQAAQVAGPVAADAKSVQINSIWDFIVKGGPVMIPIGICSFIALTVIVERLITLRRGAVIPPGFVGEVRGIVAKNPGDKTAALAFCRRNDSPIAAIFEAAFKRMGEPQEVLERHIEEAGSRVIGRLRKYLRALSVIGSIAPLLGLLGTILGMITAFETVAASGEALGRTELLAKGIYEAMITTAGGLIVAIPVVVAYHWLNARIDRLVTEMDQITVDFVEEIARPAAAIAPVQAPAPQVGTPATPLPSDGRMALAGATA